MTMIAEYLIAALLVLSGVFGLVGSYGLLKLRDTMQRLHAPTKASTVGLGGVLIASMACFWLFEGKLSWHELLVTIFLLLTAPITANFLAKAQMHRAIRKQDLPDSGTGRDWATYESDKAPVEPVMTRNDPR
ncbi:MAG TPA: Na+/H+ antiporter subunit G [Paracoccaceae bacterium]|nr:Na+/H+ antiporter subunit G [Paracoccaceae bacterium]